MTAARRPARLPRDITELVSTRLHALAALSAATTTLRVERKFGLTLQEWRSLAHLGGFAPLSQKELGRRAGLDKSLASRTVAGLIDRGLVASQRDESDGRAVLLNLTPKGQTLYRAMFDDAIARNRRLLGPLTEPQQQQLSQLLGALTVSARRGLDNERRLAAGETLDEDPPSPGGPDADLQEIRYLVARLHELVRPR